MLMCSQPKGDRRADEISGLDEVKQEHRTACVEAINTFRQEHGLLPVAISSRTADYQALSVRLRLQGAIVVQPLTQPQVDSYLTEVGPAGKAVREAIRQDPTLWDLLDAPLMLKIVTVAYSGQPESQPRLSGTLEERHTRLFEAYVDQMFRRRGVASCYTQQQTVHWLTWLAWQMVQRNQTVFYIERLQPDWLPGSQRWVYRSLDGLVFGLFYGLVVGLFGGLDLGLVCGLVFGLSVGLVCGLLGGLGIGLVCGLLGGGLGVGRDISIFDKIKLSENIVWSYLNISKQSLRAGLSSGLGIGLVGGLVYGLVGGLVVGLGFALVFGLVVGLGFALVFGLGGVLYHCSLSGFSAWEIKSRDFPNQGIHRSAWNALVVGLVSGLVYGLGIGLVVGLVYGLVFGLVVGLVVGLVSWLGFGLGAGLDVGGQACFQHVLLRLLLVRNGSIPWNCVKFLDYAAERVLLRKVGGGYTFIHRMLLEYFAARYDESSVKATPTAEPSRIERERPAPPASAC